MGQAEGSGGSLIPHVAGPEVAGGHNDFHQVRNCDASFAAIVPSRHWTDPETGYASASVGLQIVAAVAAVVGAEVVAQSTFGLHIRNRFSASFCTYPMAAVIRCPEIEIGSPFVQLKQ